MKQNQQNRRRFLKYTGGAILAGFLFIWDKMVSSDKQVAAVKSITVPFDIHRDFTFHKDFIVINNDKGIQVFSSRCTHLGCTIQQVKEGQLICPCHGSTFSSDGLAEKGPALRSLDKLNFSLDSSNQTITVEL